MGPIFLPGSPAPAGSRDFRMGLFNTIQIGPAAGGPGDPPKTGGGSGPPGAAPPADPGAQIAFLNTGASIGAPRGASLEVSQAGLGLGALRGDVTRVVVSGGRATSTPGGTGIVRGNATSALGIGARGDVTRTVIADVTRVVSHTSPGLNGTTLGDVTRVSTIIGRKGPIGGAQGIADTDPRWTQLAPAVGDPGQGFVRGDVTFAVSRATNQTFHISPTSVGQFHPTIANQLLEQSPDIEHAGIAVCLPKGITVVSGDGGTLIDDKDPCYDWFRTVLEGILDSDRHTVLEALGKQLRDHGVYDTGTAPLFVLELHMSGRSILAEYDADKKLGLVAEDLTKGTSDKAVAALKKHRANIDHYFKNKPGADLREAAVTREVFPHGFTYPVRDPMTGQVGVKVKINAFAMRILGADQAKQAGQERSTTTHIALELLHTVNHELLHAKLWTIAAAGLPLPFPNDHDDPDFKQERDHLNRESLKDLAHPAMPDPCKGVEFR